MHELPKLPYKYDALLPYIDKKTMEIHHTKHHQGYVDKLNAVLEQHPDLLERPLDELLGELDTVPENIRRAVRRSGGGHYNHSLFWRIMKTPEKDNEPVGDILQAINDSFGDVDSFKAEFEDIATEIFGSGWAWVVIDVDGSLKITATENQDNPVTDGLTPVMVLDVWEHAYYLKYQNRRAEYIENWWNVVNWEEINELYRQNKEI